ncbi:CpsD/CapB family tyrosine-protein kinase [Cutibacterium sp. WCA-380-WT-3A]|uniref:CpsD/CapB family tyrosine-protein kinase n=1 Tax=Cutibacterium porci TaxID=2605781 RepID=A0A7K0J445_9ACTN|nr:hypothetical protein [Cutibacterium porci]MSS44710.1 CpsD/CapB family tyrosine-protein kinase [Cutibacterium porci]
MSIIMLTSPGGSPGVTTTALGLALSWPRDVILVDADPCPGHVVESGYLMGRVPPRSGLIGLAAACRDGADPVQAMWEETIELPHDCEDRMVGLLSGYGHLGQASLMGPAWSSLVSAMIELGQAGVDVIVDAGRLGPEALPESLVARACLIAIVTGSRLRQLAGLSMRSEEVEALSSATTGAVGLVIVGPGRPYSSREIGRQFGLPVFGDVVFDAHAAAVLTDGEPAKKRWARGRYATSVQGVAQSMHEMARRTHQAIAGPELLSASTMDVAS